MAVPPWIGKNVVSLPRTHHALVYQAHLREDLTAAVREAGGPAALLNCAGQPATVMTEGFQVPMVAFLLNVPTTRIEAPPTLGGSAYPEPASAAPNLILQTRDTRSASRLPFLSTWPSVRYHYVGTGGPVHMFTQGCSGGAA